MDGCAPPTRSAPCASSRPRRGLPSWPAGWRTGRPGIKTCRARRSRQGRWASMRRSPLCRTDVRVVTASSSSPSGRLDGDSAFVAAVDAADASTLTVDALLAAAGREVVAVGAGDPIVYVHTLTPSAAIRQVADLVDGPVVDLVLGCAWRTVAALVSTYRLPHVESEGGVGGRRRAAHRTRRRQR